MGKNPLWFSSLRGPARLSREPTATAATTETCLSVWKPRIWSFETGPYSSRFRFKSCVVSAGLRSGPHRDHVPDVLRCRRPLVEGAGGRLHATVAVIVPGIR